MTCEKVEAPTALYGCTCGWTSFDRRFNLAYHAEAHGCAEAKRIAKKYNMVNSYAASTAETA
jgi:hypothetical protein